MSSSPSAGIMQLNAPSAHERSELKGGTRPPDGLARCAQKKTRPEAAFHQNQLHRSGSGLIGLTKTAFGFGAGCRHRLRSATLPRIAVLFVSILAVTAFAAPSAPTNLAATSVKATSFTLTWAASTGGTGGIAAYDVYKNGVLLGSTGTTRTLAVSGLSPTATYTMTVVARDAANYFSPTSAALAVTTPADTTPPSKPSNLAAAGISTTTCTLTWTGSTDDVGVTRYNVYRASTLVGSTGATSLNLTGLTPDTANNLTVRATDAAGNLSAASVALAVQTLANPPSVPTGLAATTLKAISFTLTWTASTGGTGGIAGYDIFQNGALLGSTTTARTFAVAGLSPTTTYNMTVTARDTAGRVSAPSAGLAVTTPADTTPPTKPSALTVSANTTTTTSCALTWTGSTDDVGVTGYNIYRNGALVGSTTTTLAFDVTGLTPDTNNNLTVRATDAAGNLSAASVALAVQTLALPPSVPTGLVATNLKPASFKLTWTASTGGKGGIVGYDVYLNGMLVGSPATRSLALTGLTPKTAYSMTVVSRDTAGNVSGPSAALIVTTPADTAKPTVPKGLSAADVTPSSFNFIWTPSNDNVGVTGYEVYRNTVLIGTTPATSFAVSGLPPSTISSMRVKASDAAGNVSAFSAILSVTTSAPPNILPAVELTAPVDGAIFTLPFSLTLFATATDSDGTIAKVEFFDNGVLLGETTASVFGQPEIWLLSLSSQLPAGNHSLTARATDNRNATTDSAPVAITANNPNSSPAIILTSPANGTSTTAPGFLTLSAEATDSDGTITKVDFYEGSNFLGEVTTPSTAPATFTFPLTLFSTGTYTITAVATDNSGTATPSTAIVVTVQSGAAALPFVANFETTEGYRPGPLLGQLSWFATGGVSVAPSSTSGSLQELSISAAQPTDIYSHDFSAPGVSPVFVDFSARPVAGADPATAVMFSTPAAQVALVGSGSLAQLWIFGGGVGWYATSQTVVTDASGHTVAWLRLTTREDYATKKWDLYHNGQLVAADVGFADPVATSLTDFSVNGHAATTSAFDSFYAGSENPLFVDANHNGLDDTWETAHGLALTTDNRELSPTGNGVTVLQAYLAGTDPNDFFNGATPTLTLVSGDNQTGGAGQFNAQPFVILVKNAAGTAPLANAPVTFTVQTGGGQLALTNLGTPTLARTLNLTTDAAGTAQVSFQQPAAANVASTIQVVAGTAQVSFTSTSALTDSDGNGLPDAWEMQVFGQIGVIPSADSDGDQLTNLQEFTLGTDPNLEDSDGDGVKDGLEVSLGMNPLVADAATLPGKIGGLRLLLRAGAGTTTDGNGNVSLWADQSGLANNATQATISSRPTVVANALNGQPVIRFDGNGRWYNLPNLMSGAAQGEMFVVLKAGVVPSDRSRIPWSLGGSFGSAYPAGSTLYDDFGSTSQWTLGVPGQNITAYHLYNATSRLNEWIARINGLTLFQSSTNTVSFRSDPMLGRTPQFANNYFFDGDIAEMIVYDSVLSNALREAVNLYLVKKYALSVTPPAVTGLTANAIGATQSRLSWISTSQFDQVIYEIERKTGAGAYAKIGETSGTSYSDPSLSPLTTYTYRVRVRMLQTAGGYSNDATVMTFAAGAASLPVSGIRLWLEADQGALGVGSLSTWYDQSGLGNNAVQAQAPYAPQVVTGAINGQPVVRFNGTSSYLNLPQFMGGVPSGELFIVMKSSASAGQDYGIIGSLGVSDSIFPTSSYYPTSAGQIREAFGTTTPYAFSANGVDLRQPRLYSVSAANNAWTATLDGSVLFSTGVNATNFANGSQTPLLGAARNSYYGGSGPVSFFAGDVAEIIIYDHALSAGERQAVGSYLTNKYALGIAPAAAPTNLGAIVLSPTKVSLSWTGSSGSQFVVERSVDGGAIWQTVVSLSGQTSYTDTGLSGSTTYSYRLKAANFGGASGYATAVAVTTLPVGSTTELPQTGMKLWLRPETLVQAGGGLSLWLDQSGLGNDGVQTQSSNAPQVVTGAINGQPVVRFNGTSSYLNLPQFMGGVPSGELFIVMKSSASAGQDYGIIGSLGVSDSIFPTSSYYPTSAGQIREAFGTTTPYAFSANGVDLRQPRLYSVSAANNAWTATLDGSVLFSTGVNATNFANGSQTPLLGAARNSYYGGSGPVSFFAGDVAEIIIYDHALSAWDREIVGAYLNRKYAITSPSTFDQLQDLNMDGIPDGVGRLMGIDPTNLDVDGDGIPNWVEIANGTNPFDPDTDHDGVPDGLDAFPLDPLRWDLAGTAPMLSIISGNGQVTQAGQFDAQALRVSVKNSAGTTPLINVPVTIAVQNGGGLLALTDIGGPVVSSTLNLLTDANGQVQAFYQQPDSSYVQSVIRITAGTGTATFTSLSTRLGDIDGNQLPDAWEIQHFSQIGTDPNADPDGDGLTNLQEFQQGSDPFDFYNATAPVLQIVSGNNQNGSAGQFNAQPFVISLKNVAGTAPLANAPVLFEVLTEGGRLTQSLTGTPALSTSLTLMTDSNGRVQVYYQQPSIANLASTIRVKAGLSESQVQTSDFTAGNSPTDSDLNGLPDAWEIQYFGAIGIDPDADPDGDRVTNLNELLTGRNPTKVEIPDTTGSVNLRVFSPSR